MTDPNTLDSVRQVLVESLDLPVEPVELDWETKLFGNFPELDSLGLVALVSALEDRFDIMIEDDEFAEELFETVATLTTFVETKISVARP